MKIKSFVISLLCLLSLAVIAQRPAASTRKQDLFVSPDRPKLVVGLVIDQMRWDYLYRYNNRYVTGGFKRLLANGFSYDNTMIPYYPAVTSAGHTCLYTGSVPAIHGIVGNDWIEKMTGKKMYCTEDKSVSTVGSYSDQGEMSPRNMLTTTVGDELRLATNFRSRVFGIALKDRGGILTAGHSANAAYWLDDSTGNWITSTYYMNELPAWVDAFNKKKKADSMMQNDWNLLYDISLYDQSTTDDNNYEKTLNNETQRTFPHSYKNIIGKNYYPFRQSPYGNTYTLDFAKQLISNEGLGKSGQTDMLCVSLSSTDNVGHQFGPNSLEVEDTYLRLDIEIADFLNYLDATVGAGNYLFFLSADHGAPQVANFLRDHKLPGGAVNKSAFVKELNQYCASKFGYDKLIRFMYESQVYLDDKRIDSLKLDINEVKNTVLAYARKMPEVIHAFDYASFDKVILPAPVKEKFALGYFPKRAGEIQLVLKSQYIEGDMIGTEHGMIYPYDAHIPLIWYGWNISAGSTSREVYMTDVAPTISALLKIQMPGGSIGKVLPEIVK